jgi:hypothetical protein
MVVVIKIANENESKLWDQIVNTSQKSTLFHTWRALKIIEKYSKTKLYPVMVFRNEEAIGCIPLFYFKKLFMKFLFSPPPHVALSRLGPLMVTPDNLTQHKKETLHNEFQEKVNEYIYTEINPDCTMLSSAHLQDSRSFKWRGFQIEPTYNYSFNIKNNAIDNIWNNFKKNTRGDIQRAQRRGFSVREGNKEDMLRIYELLEKRYEEQKRKVHVSKEYLLEMYEAFYPSNLKIFVVEHEGNVVTGNIEVYFKQNAITWIGIAKAAQHANDFLTWECLKYANSIDISDYGIMGVAGDERLSKFYSKFNPDLGVSFSAKKYSSVITKLIYETYAFSKSWLKI